MVRITSMVMETVQFNHFPLCVYGSFLLLPWQPNQEAERQITIILVTLNDIYQPTFLPNQSHIVSVVLEESFKKSLFFFFYLKLPSQPNEMGICHKTS